MGFELKSVSGGSFSLVNNRSGGAILFNAVSTSTGQFNSTSSFGGVSIFNLSAYNTGSGYVIITKL